MSKFLVTGGLQRDNASSLGSGQKYYEARLVEVDFEHRKTQILLGYPGVADFYPDEFPNILFTCATLKEGRLYLCSETEVFIYSYPELDLINKASYPFFQNVHHVAPVLNYVAVVSTGLDMVILLDENTLEPVRFINPMGKDPWHRFSRDVDYRKVHDTKPHDVHPNFVFENNGEIWVTRFNQKDAVCVQDTGKKIDIGLERIHDGHVVGDYIYFTVVNGCVAIANRHTYKVEEVVDLNEIDSHPGPLGWCRGMAIMGDVVYVGFSRLRQTAIKENVKWALNYFGRPYECQTRITAYDIVRKIKVDEYFMPKTANNVIYSVLPVE